MKKIIAFSLLFGIIVSYLTYYLTTGDMFPFSHNMKNGIVFVLQSMIVSTSCLAFLIVLLTPSQQDNTTEQ